MEPIDYVVGIDFGHGETSAAFCAVARGTNVINLQEPEDLRIGERQENKVLPSAIYDAGENEPPFIGESAMNCNRSGRVCFKKVPQNIHGEDEQLMIEFMRAVYGRVREQKRGVLTDDNHKVWIAVPSGWLTDEVNLYRQMAESAGIPVGGIMRESRAAILRIQHNQNAGAAQDISQGVVVFDLGSSTLDLTYYSKHISKPVDFGYDCGASFVEQMIFSKLKETDDNTKNFLDLHPNKKYVLLFKLREKKEYYYSQKECLSISVDLDELDRTDQSLNGLRARIKFEEKDELTSMLADAGYLSRIADDLSDFKKKYIKDGEIRYVVLTGGASNMGFIKELVSNCWNLEIDRIIKDQSPSLTISRGIAEVARMDVRTAEAMSEIKTAIEKLDLYDICQKAIEIYPTELSEEIGKYLKNKSKDWKDLSTREAIVNNIKNELQIINEDTNLLQSIVLSLIRNILVRVFEEHGIQEKVNAVVGEFANGFTVGINMDSLSLSNLSTKDLYEMMIKSISVEGDGNQALMIAAVAAKMGSILGWVGIVLGFFGGFVIAKLFGDEVNNIDNLKNRMINKTKEGIRDTVRTHLKEHIQETEKAFGEAIDMMIKAYVEELNIVRRLIS